MATKLVRYLQLMRVDVRKVARLSCVPMEVLERFMSSSEHARKTPQQIRESIFQAIAHISAWPLPPDIQEFAMSDTVDEDIAARYSPSLWHGLDS